MRYSLLAAFVAILLRGLLARRVPYPIPYVFHACSLCQFSFCLWLQGLGDVPEQEELDVVELFGGVHRIHDAGQLFNLKADAYDVTCLQCFQTYGSKGAEEYFFANLTLYLKRVSK